MFRIKGIIIIFISIYNIFCQNIINSNSLSLPANFIPSKIRLLDNKNAKNKQSNLKISINFQQIVNKGHPNVDNNAEFYSASKSSRMFSSRFSLKGKYFDLELEPYLISNLDIFDKDTGSGTLWINNNHLKNVPVSKNDFGFKQSRFIIHFNGFGIGYGNMSHWWSPGFHSSIVLSSNAPSQKTFSFGTFKDIKYKNLSFGSNVILIPYRNKLNEQIYFSGLKSHISYSNKSIKVTSGLHRTYLSGDFKDLSLQMSLNRRWTELDALQLVFEPLFGQSKKSLEYSLINTPGFDVWDQILSGYLKIEFLNDNLDLYLNLASDDNRANFTDLKAHWDHTLGYIIGYNKLHKISGFNLFHGIEYLSTKVSNTFNPLFFRGDPNSINYYTNEEFDYFTYKGRRMGAHSGSSSDDLIGIFGVDMKDRMLIGTINYERHGLKSEKYPELKFELTISYHTILSDKSNIFISFENEWINNYSFIKNNHSKSTLIWFGYSFFFKN
tara:strand:+ start:20106 stop:21593 length:1488 start_codon:yes stop_codon:yes gene_type:complete